MPKITSLNMMIRKLYSLLSRSKDSFKSRRLLIEQIHPSSFISYDRIHAKRGCVLSIDELCQIDGTIAFEREHASVSIGKRVFMNGMIISAENVTIGNDILISWGVTIVDHNSHSPLFSQRANDVIMWREHKKDWSHVKISPIRISDKVWIGFNTIILCGVTIGEGAIIGAGSVVTRDVPAWSVAAGNPARVIREIPLHER